VQSERLAAGTKHRSPTTFAIVQNLEFGAVEDFFGQLELIFERREEGVAFYDALHEGEV
jgi:hypothetical protein